jgi:hypothetical protein
MYQPRTRVISDKRFVDTPCIDYANGKYHCVENDAITVYSENFSRINTITMSGLTDMSYAGISTDGISYIFIATSTTLYKLNYSSGSIVEQFSIPLLGDCVGVSSSGTNIWLMYGGGKLAKLTNQMGLLAVYELPFGAWYQGLTMSDSYLVTANNDGDLKTFYHIEPTTGGICNVTYSPDIPWVNDLCYVNNQYALYSKDSNRILLTHLNTVVLDIYKLEKEIETKRYVDMIDDLGFTVRVFVSSLSKDRVLNYEHMYKCGLTIEKIDRG